MDDSAAYLAITAARKANEYLLSARKHLIGSRLPMAGVQRDLDKALIDLRAAHRVIAEAIVLIETHPSSIETRGNSDGCPANI